MDLHVSAFQGVFICVRFALDGFQFARIFTSRFAWIIEKICYTCFQFTRVHPCKVPIFARIYKGCAAALISICKDSFLANGDICKDCVNCTIVFNLQGLPSLQNEHPCKLCTPQSLQILATGVLQGLCRPDTNLQGCFPCKWGFARIFPCKWRHLQGLCQGYS